MLLRHIRYLLAVAEHANFTRAAEALYVSQPTLSHQIRQLEEALGAQLLDRTGRSIKLTDAGQSYVDYVRKALRELEAGKRAIHDVRDLSRGTLRIAMTPTFTSYLVGPLVECFNTRYPNITLRIHEVPLNAIESALASDDVDLGIAFSEARSSEIACESLFIETLSVVVGVHHSFARRLEPITIRDLEQTSLALLTDEFATRNFIDAYFQEHDISPKVVIEANTISAIIEIIRRADIATILPDAITRENDALRSIRLAPILPRRTVALLRRKGGYESAASQAFAELIKTTISEKYLPESS